MPPCIQNARLEEIAADPGCATLEETKHIARELRGLRTKIAALAVGANPLDPRSITVQTTPDNPTWKEGDRVRVADTRLTHYGKAGVVVRVDAPYARPVMVGLEGVAYYSYYEHIELEAEHKS